MIQNLFRLVFVSLLVLSVLLSLTPTVAHVSLNLNDKIIHAFAYFSLMMAFDFSWRSGRLLIIKAILVLLYSGLIEYAQDLVPGRHMSSADIVANAVGIGVFLLLVLLFRKIHLYQTLKLA
ncbi:MAG: VanZ family protein [Pseudomonadota bacterium]